MAPPAACVRRVSATAAHAGRIRAAVGVSVLWGLWAGAREGGAGWREAPRGTARRPAAPAHVWGGPLPLRCPGPAAPPRHALVLAHEVQRRPARRGGGALTRPPPSGRRQGRAGGI